MSMFHGLVRGNIGHPPSEGSGGSAAMPASAGSGGAAGGVPASAGAVALEPASYGAGVAAGPPASNSTKAGERGPVPPHRKRPIKQAIASRARMVEEHAHAGRCSRAKKSGSQAGGRVFLAEDPRAQDAQLV